MQHRHDATRVQLAVRKQRGMPKACLPKLVTSAHGRLGVGSERRTQPRLEPLTRVGGVGMSIGRAADPTIGEHPRGKSVDAFERHEQPLSRVELDVPSRLSCHVRVEEQHELSVSGGQLAVDHLVTGRELVDKALSLGREEDAAHAAHHLTAEDFGRGVGLGRVDEASRVHLYTVHVDSASAYLHGQLHAIASRPLAVGRRVREKIWTMLGQQRRVRAIVRKAAGGQDRLGRAQLHLLAARAVDVSHARHARCRRHAATAFEDEPRHAAASPDGKLPALGVSLELLVQSERELGADHAVGWPMRTCVRVAAQLSELREVDRCALKQPLDRRRRALREQPNQAGSLSLGRARRVGRKSADGIIGVALRARVRWAAAVDAG
mmetsp:Transcript_20711/g.52800  ORF Transcript_20711/g.52800 Transcript_20711/m.52800 type:complete len:379 (-) Transcript_20711:1384-2520(-)